MGNNRLDSSSSSVQLCHRGGCGSSIHSVEIELAQVAVQDLPRNAFRKQIRRVFITLDFEEGEVATPQALLDPKLAHCQVANTPDAASATYANGRGRVGMHADHHAEAEIQSPGLDAKCLCGAFDQAVQLGFRGAEGHCTLRAGPMLNQVSAANGHPT